MSHWKQDSWLNYEWYFCIFDRLIWWIFMMVPENKIKILWLENWITAYMASKFQIITFGRPVRNFYLVFHLLVFGRIEYQNLYFLYSFCDTLAELFETCHISIVANNLVASPFPCPTYFVFHLLVLGRIEYQDLYFLYAFCDILATTWSQIQFRIPRTAFDASFPCPASI